MDSIHICGRNTLCGELSIHGSKNATLPVLAATILIEGVSVIHNCPRITDIFYMIKLLECLGCRIEWNRDSIIVDTRGVTPNNLPSECVSAMRSSVILLGAMAGRFGEAAIHYPGGCVIGERPIDIHKKALEMLNVTFEEEDEIIQAKTTGLIGNTITLDFPSVGATENVILAAVTAEGVTNIYNCAREPEITELCRFLKSTGARIKGDGTSHIMIEGVAKLQETDFEVASDRIVAGTYMLAAAATRGMVLFRSVPIEHMRETFLQLKNLGAELEIKDDVVWLNGENARRSISFLETKPYPDFPTDLQSPLLSVLAIADGTSVIKENIFENRFRVVEHLCNMGAGIEVKGNIAYVQGVNKLHGAMVKAEELRGGAALVIAGLLAEGETVIENRHYIDRGYEDICRDFRIMGAKIR